MQLKRWMPYGACAPEEQEKGLEEQLEEIKPQEQEMRNVNQETTRQEEALAYTYGPLRVPHRKIYPQGHCSDRLGSRAHGLGGACSECPGRGVGRIALPFVYGHISYFCWLLLVNCARRRASFGHQSGMNPQELIN
jgi:hypothetical protein